MSLFRWSICFGIMSTAVLTAQEKKAFTDVAGAYSIDFPTKPAQRSAPLETPQGKFTVNLAACKSDGMDLVVTHTDMRFANPAAIDAEKIIDDVSNRLVGKNKIASNKKITIDKYPGRELVIDRGEAKTRVQTYLVEQRVYQIIASGPAEKIDGTDAFFDSFKLSAKRPAPPPANKKGPTNKSK